MSLYLRLFTALTDRGDIACTVIRILVYPPPLLCTARLVLGNSVGRIAAVCRILDGGGQYQTAVCSVYLAVWAAVQSVIAVQQACAYGQGQPPQQIGVVFFGIFLVLVAVLLLQVF